MHILDTVIIEGFWGERRLEFDLYDDVNFIIGINGSGKTTAVNLVVAALTADFQELYRLEFSKIIVKLKAKKSKKKPSVTIIKKVHGKSPFPSIEYEIRDSSDGKPSKFSLDDFEEQKRFRGYLGRVRHEKTYRNNNIVNIIGKLVNVSWLSVHRTSLDRDSDDDIRLESTVDKKLRELSNRLVRFFSSLGKQGAQLLEDFQKTVFLSMLYSKTKHPLFSTAESIDLDGEKKALEGIFSQFNLNQIDFINRLDDHFYALGKAKEQLKAGGQRLTPKDISVLIATERIDYIVDEWNKLLAKRKKIFEPQNTYLATINKMMQRKHFAINDENELEITTQSGRTLPIRRLSSGEKQLLIVLGEALLQEKKNWVYIADEPELSLHVRWQESLVENLRAINPNAQIIFATHSPDVVSCFGNNVFDMEKML